MRNQEMKNWAENVSYIASEVAAPTSLAELQQLVAASSRVKALGSRHSFNDSADTSGLQIRVDQLPADVSLDTSGTRATVTCAAGLTHAALSDELARAGWALPTMASLPHISVAGAIQTGTHGSGVTLPALSGAVVGLEVVDAEGELRAVRRGDADFPGLLVGLGAFGVVTTVTQEVVPAFEVEQRVFLGASWDLVSQNVRDVLACGYSVSLFTRFDTETIPQIWVKTTASDDVPASIDLLARAGAHQATVTMHPLPDTPTDNVTDQLGVRGPSHRRLPHFRHDFKPGRGDEIQSEYLLDMTVAASALEAVRRLGHLVAPVLHVAEIRAVAADDAWLSPSSGRDSLAIHFTWKSRPDEVMEVVPLLEAALLPLGARPHWGKVFTYSSDDLRTNVPLLGDFTELVQHYDPTAKFDNAFLQRVLGPR